MESRFAEHVLPNGLRVICEVMPRVRSAAVAFLVRTGSRDERPDEHGVSHFLEHMCFKGTRRRDWRAITVRFDELGSIYNAFTGKEHTVYYGWVPAERVAEQIELLADMMRPALPPAEYETERRVILEEIAMSADSFEHHVFDFLHRVVFGTHPLAHEILGERETIAALPRARMQDYLRRRYAPGNMVLLVSGAVDPQEVFAAAGRCCGAWRGRPDAPADPPPPALRAGAVHRLHLPRFRQQSVVLVYPSVPLGHPLSEQVEAFTAIFGGPNSRCYWNIVQKGICPVAGVAWVAYRDCGLLAFYADGEPQRCEEMLAALRAEIRRVARHGVRAAEVQRVRNLRRTHLALEAENPRSRLMQLVDDLEAYGHVRTIAARMAAVQAVSPRGIARYLREYPIDGPGVLLSCGPREWPAQAEAAAPAAAAALPRRGRTGLPR